MSTSLPYLPAPPPLLYCPVTPPPFFTILLPSTPFFTPHPHPPSLPVGRGVSRIKRSTMSPCNTHFLRSCVHLQRHYHPLSLGIPTLETASLQHRHPKASSTPQHWHTPPSGTPSHARVAAHVTPPAVTSHAPPSFLPRLQHFTAFPSAELGRYSWPPRNPPPAILLLSPPSPALWKAFSAWLCILIG